MRNNPTFKSMTAKSPANLRDLAQYVVGEVATHGGASDLYFNLAGWPEDPEVGNAAVDGAHDKTGMVMRRQRAWSTHTHAHTHHHPPLPSHTHTAHKHTTRRILTHAGRKAAMQAKVAEEAAVRPAKEDAKHERAFLVFMKTVEQEDSRAEREFEQEEARLEKETEMTAKQDAREEAAAAKIFAKAAAAEEKTAPAEEKAAAKQVAPEAKAAEFEAKAAAKATADAEKTAAAQEKAAAKQAAAEAKAAESEAKAAAADEKAAAKLAAAVAKAAVAAVAVEDRTWFDEQLAAARLLAAPGDDQPCAAQCGMTWDAWEAQGMSELAKAQPRRGEARLYTWVGCNTCEKWWCSCCAEICTKHEAVCKLQPKAAPAKKTRKAAASKAPPSKVYTTFNYTHPHHTPKHHTHAYTCSAGVQAALSKPGARRELHINYFH